MKKIIIFICFYLFFFDYSFCEEETDAKNSIPEKKTQSGQILRIVTDQFFEDLFSKFGILFKGDVNVVKFRKNNTEELTRIFEEVCQKSNFFQKKNLPNYEPQIIVSSRDMNQFERSICGNRFEKIKLGYYAFLILSKKSSAPKQSSEINFLEENSEENETIDFSSQDFFYALTQNIFDENLFEFVKNPFNKWNELNRFLPEKEIKIYGPKSNSPFFLFLKDSILSPICLKQKFYSFKFNPINFEESLKFCSNFRIDSFYIEDDPASRLSSEKILSDEKSFFIVPFHIQKRLKSKNNDLFLIHNFDGVIPSEENIRNSRYIFSWPIYLFIEKDFLKSSELVKSFLTEITSKSISGEKGVLTEYGLISK